MFATLSTSKKNKKIEIAIKIMALSKIKSISISKASSKYKKNRRFIYDVNRRWIKKNNSDVNEKLIEQFKMLFNSK
jgi:hypothetical protein